MVLVARALASQPELLVLDEPESNLDFRNQRVVLDLIRQLCREQGISSILNTHYPEHAIELSDSVLLLRREGSAVFGEAHEVMTEENLQGAFGVQVYIRTVPLENRSYTCVIPGSRTD